jgi:FKBP-type peptidyl-prolyl cis-trans isomerase SlyD
MSEQIRHGKVGTFHYTLTDGDGNVLDSSDGGAPMVYMHGHGNIVPGLEREMEGKQAGDQFQVTVAPADGYGEREGVPQAVPRDRFPAHIDIQAGMGFQAQTETGEVVPLWVDRVEGSTVYVDENHPLAGVTLNFAVQVVGVRDATETELEHGHVHDGDGHHH